MNAERKEEYFNKLNINRSVRSSFNRAAILEDLFGKDLCEFSQNEINDMYAYLSYKTETKYGQVNREYKIYTAWCMEKGFCSVNNYELYTMKDFSQFINREMQSERFVTREQLLNAIKSLQNPRDQFIMLAVFEFGKSPEYKNIIEFRLSDINEKAGTVRLPSGHTVNISSELINIAYQSSEENTYYKATSEGTLELKTIGEGDVFKVAKYGKDINGSQMVKRVAKIIKRNAQFSGLNEDVSGTTLMESGIFEFIRKRCADINMSYREYIYSDMYSEIKKQYPFFSTAATTFWNDFKYYI